MIWFLLAAVTIGLGGLIVQRRVLAGPGGLAPERLHGAEVGYLVGGPRRAVAAVLAGLRVDGSIAFTDGRVIKGRPAAQTWGRLGPRVRIAAATDTGVRGLLHHPTVTDAMHAMRSDLTAGGWLLSERNRHRARLIGAPMWALAAVGLILVVDAAADDRPFGWWIVATGAVAYAAGWLSRAPELNTGARRALERFTEANDQLSPAASPGLLTYGATAAAVAVGLFGTIVLLPLDPDLALAADLMSVEPDRPATRELADTGSGCAGGGGSGCGTGSGSGSGSSGSSGGGSSCGGGCGGGCGGCGGE